MKWYVLLQFSICMVVASSTAYAGKPAAPSSCTPVKTSPFSGVVLVNYKCGADEGEDCAPAADGGIIAGGSAFNGTNSDFAVTKVSSAGALSFTRVTAVGSSYENALAMTMTSVGKIILGGTWLNGGTNEEWGMTRYSATGVLDTSFGSSGKVKTNVTTYGDSIKEVKERGDFLYAFGTANSQMAIARYNAVTGAIDNTFGVGCISSANYTCSRANGVLILRINTGPNEGKAMALDAAGNLVIAGYANVYGGGSQHLALARLSNAGVPDPTFGVNGIVETSLATESVVNAIALQADGKIVVGGWADYYKAVIGRYDTNGQLDATFNPAGAIPGILVDTYTTGGFTSVQAVTIQADNKILVSGNEKNGTPTSVMVARYDQFGARDAGFGTDGVSLTNINGSGGGRCVYAQPDGKIVVSGYATNGADRDVLFMRLQATGALDPDFN